MVFKLLHKLGGGAHTLACTSLALRFALFRFICIDTMVEYIYNEYIHDCGTWHVVAPHCVDIITDQWLSHEH